MSWLARASIHRHPNSRPFGGITSEPSRAGFVAGKRARPAASLHCLDEDGRSVRARSSVPTTALVVSWNGRRAARLERRAARFRSTPTPPVHAGDRVAKAALRPGVRPHLDPSVLGLVLADGLRIGLPDRRADPLRLRVRPVAHLVTTRHRDARVRAVPDRLQYKPVSVVQAGLVLFAVCDDRVGVRGQGVDPVEPGRTADARLQSVCVHTHGIFSGPDCDRHERHHMSRYCRHVFCPPLLFRS